MNKEELKAILPHRNSMLLLDEAEKIGDEAHASYTVRGDEFFLDGHFPSFKVVPGVILCEILAQSMPLYAGIDKVRFKRPVRPGDTLKTVCRITKSKGIFYFAEGTGYVDGEIAVKAEFSFALADKDSLCSQKS